MKTGNSKHESPPLSHLYGLVCGFYNWSKETSPRSTHGTCLAVFAEYLRKQNFSGLCRSSRQAGLKSHTQIRYP